MNRFSLKASTRGSWWLFLVSCLFLILGLGVLFLKQHASGAITRDMVLGMDYLPWLLADIGVSFMLQSILLKKKGFSPWLFPMSLFFSSIGLVEIARLKPILFIPQLRWLLIGMLVFMVVLKYGKAIVNFTRYQYLLGIATLILLALPLLFGTEIGGNRNWVVIGPVQVQPSEFSKILLVLFLAAYLSDHKEVLTTGLKRYLFLRLPPLRFIAPLLCIWGMALLMFVVAHDLGAALLFFGIAVLMTYMATGSRSYVFLALLFFFLASVLSYFLFGHVRVRFDIWLNPWNDPNGDAYQVVQSLFAFGSGGVWGTGFAHGHPGLIPEVHTDFIFAAIAEEFGLIGSLTLMCAYAMFFVIGIRIACSCRRKEHILLAAGGSVVFLLQAFIIIAGVSKFLPLTGITLPFISYGGSSMVSGFFLLGMMEVLSRRGDFEHENR